MVTMNKQEIYKESLTTISYMLLGLKETANIINPTSFDFWKDICYDQLTRNYAGRIKENEHK